MILPDPKFLDKWQSEAGAAGLSVSSWVFETVEARDLADPIDSTEINALREEIRNLKKERDAARLELERERTAMFKERNAPLLRPGFKQFEIEKGVIDALRLGGIWNERDLLKELDVDSHDVDAIKLMGKQLEILQICELVEETPQGWKWIK